MARLTLMILLCGWIFIVGTVTEARGQINETKCHATTDRMVYRYPRDESVDIDYLKLTVTGPPLCMPSESGDGSQLMIQKYVGPQWGKPYGPAGWQSVAKMSAGKSVYTIRLLPTLYERGQSRVIIVDGAGKELAKSNLFYLKER